MFDFLTKKLSSVYDSTIDKIKEGTNHFLNKACQTLKKASNYFLGNVFNALSLDENKYESPYGKAYARMAKSIVYLTPIIFSAYFAKEAFTAFAVIASSFATVCSKFTILLITISTVVTTLSFLASSSDADHKEAPKKAELKDAQDQHKRDTEAAKLKLKQTQVEVNQQLINLFKNQFNPFNFQPTAPIVSEPVSRDEIIDADSKEVEVKRAIFDQAQVLHVNNYSTKSPVRTVFDLNRQADNFLGTDIK
ncbi:MAG: hypothetical protein J0H68_07495 [Sphingobacteriia bacterium]|nr:hypothetical protein [Sphingobacteriia bacterium]